MTNLKQLVPEDDLTISKSTTLSITAGGEYTEPIPVDLLIDIFSRVPSKSIARFRCLSKSWAYILSRPYFTELFLTKSFNHPRLLFTVSVSYGELVFFSTPQTRPSLGANSSFVATIYQTSAYYLYHPIISSIHGLVCFQDWEREYSKLVICNPVTGEIITLPAVQPHYYCPRYYFVYDPTHKKIKVLCLCPYNYIIWAQVLTLETGKHLWRKIYCKFHWPLFSQGHMICIDGVLYYLARFNKRRSTGSVIVCFDVRTEKFSFIKIDDESMAKCSTLINYKGRLGAVQFTDSNQITLRLWLLEDADGINKWSTDIYELPLSWKHRDTFKIVGMTRTCDVVLSPCKFSDPFYVFYYNVERKTLTRIEIQGLQKLKCLGAKVYAFQDYVEDLPIMKSYC